VRGEWGGFVSVGGLVVGWRAVRDTYWVGRRGVGGYRKKGRW
jgi:hypothetical protein